MDGFNGLCYLHQSEAIVLRFWQKMQCWKNTQNLKKNSCENLFLQLNNCRRRVRNYLKKDFNERACLVIQLGQSRTKTHSHTNFFSFIAFTVQALPKQYCDIAVFIMQYLSAAMIKKYICKHLYSNWTFLSVYNFNREKRERQSPDKY